MHPLAEYPRPAMRRDSCEILNGPWQYAITQTAEYPAACCMRQRGTKRLLLIFSIPCSSGIAPTRRICSP